MQRSRGAIILHFFIVHYVMNLKNYMDKNIYIIPWTQNHLYLLVHFLGGLESNLKDYNALIYMLRLHQLLHLTNPEISKFRIPWKHRILRIKVGAKNLLKSTFYLPSPSLSPGVSKYHENISYNGFLFSNWIFYIYIY